MRKINSLVMLVKNIDDCKELDNKNIRYINIDINNPDIGVIKYLLDNSSKYLISDYINNKYGYVYVTLDKYKKGQNIINNLLLDVMNNDYNELEIARYLYVRLGKIVNMDINAIDNKSDIYSFNNISNINNIWEAIYLGKVNNNSLCKLYLYLCSLVGLDCELVNSDDDYVVNKININDKSIIVDITKDLSYIQTGCKTKFFDNYNDDIELDKKIGYINDNYNDNFIDMIMKKIDYSLKGFLYNILVVTGSVIDIDNVGSYELYNFYKELFSKYCNDYDIKVNNLYINQENGREHFILISYNNMHYSYNYNKTCFVEIDNNDLNNNFNANNIGMYLDSDLELINYDVIEEI